MSGNGNIELTKYNPNVNGSHVNEGFIEGEPQTKPPVNPSPTISAAYAPPQHNVDDVVIETIPKATENPDPPSRGFWTSVDEAKVVVGNFYTENRKPTLWTIAAICVVAYIAYFVKALSYDYDEAEILIVFTCIAVVIVIYVVVRDNFGTKIEERVLKPASEKIDDNWGHIKWPLYILIVVALIIVLVLLTIDSPENLISLAGLAIFVLFTYVFSKHPGEVKWRPVLWGLMLQFLLGLFVLRTNIGFEIFEWLGDKATLFLEFTDAGSKFLFGELYTNHFFAFKVLPVVIFFSSVISILYYIGLMQLFIEKIAWLMQFTMKTSAGESLNAAGNIFIGQTEAPLMVRPFLKNMTLSEIHAIMTGGFATIAGSVLGAYISFGVDASHLISASVMSAPAALAMSKLFWPETEESKMVTVEQVKLPKGEERNVVEAASVGASAAVSLVANIAANLIAFLAILAFFNAMLTWLGGLVGIEDLTFELICSYVFMPVAFIMGVEWEDCREVAELIGLKTFLNEFVAYIRLGEFIDNGQISKRSEVIATYALCGFANIGSIGIQLGGLTPMAPSRKADFATVSIRALIAGTVACFMTACIAGILYEEIDVTTLMMNATTIAPVT
ncbi:solute carrier family 28 member 3-like isoform X2 [Anneissia japonica]|uniref:solute carrier family 28 member 3-like isoform X2 n=1 Tax=Anneissia japonica TaxID=1529436 RepID=UPI0014259809|nr:solute carrier family 28 member 3-like isoform X2 [Anneissia japonica]XP_033101814.1 solute carrier family 28 member 3-like isoform X2 [Anneissia japonica]XP_033101815.1 solute carrier family 28 member 3-like isoform X2 [Anneissia japonica]